MSENINENTQKENKQVVRKDGNKKLIELQDSLKKGETVRKPLADNSRLRMVLCDYKNKEQGGSISVYFNFSKEELNALLFDIERCQMINTLEFNQHMDKIFGEPDANGYSQVTKFSVSRQIKDQNGTVKNYPIFISIENGRGIKNKTQTGGCAIKGGSYVCDKKAFINLTDKDFSDLLKEGINFIERMSTVYATEINMTQLIKENLNVLYRTQAEQNSKLAGWVSNTVTANMLELLKTGGIIPDDIELSQAN